MSQFEPIQPGSNQSQNIRLGLVDNSGRMTNDFLRKQLEGAKELDVCTGYISPQGLEFLAEWLEGMAPEARVRLLVGMPPFKKWRYYKPSEKTAQAFLSQHLKQDEPEPDLSQLELLCRNKQFEVRLVLQAPSLHAKLFQWKDSQGVAHSLIGSSNMTGVGLQNQQELNMYVKGRCPSEGAWFEGQWNRSFPFEFIPLPTFKSPKGVPRNSTISVFSESVSNTSGKSPALRNHRSRTAKGCLGFLFRILLCNLGQRWL